MSVLPRAHRASIFIAALLMALSGSVRADENSSFAAPFRIAALADSAGDPDRAPTIPAEQDIAADPFPLPGFRIAEGALRAKWRAVESQIGLESEMLARCRTAPDDCIAPEARRFLAIVDAARARTGRALIGEINRSINLSIRPASDLIQHGAADVWSAPLKTLATGRGDCEDYAIAKLVALREAGMKPDDLRLLIVRDPIARDDHAVAAARLHGRWLVLDNRRFAMIDVADTKYMPLFFLQQDEAQFAANATAATGTGIAPILM